ncbi:acetaldehyde dehydrogenase [Robbsia andropogonis]|uniref:Acetaldehyde dehydrogenase n=1 Tax=Robbsia andropogonis TaxID=28092 RepID=A0A0F5JW21_9BURK|nr:acetaldehyde dehydrogenase (acetylating) [Robbsia andropogonis]KKB62016.1 acetaldehyde dehydrogenase [Robbsia andropogonis]MCP1119402.1 acetaldehyde dehydrogenase (acetylating) [Robbsia andropogonis]MCP1129385.1 acetaldehyde dehydrogenase (acetylating) [Robbsia andropogonis]
MGATVKVAIIGPGNIGTDLMIKVMRNSKHLKMGAMVGVDPNSDGLARAARLGIATTSEGIDGLVNLDIFKSIDIVFDATSAGAHKRHDEILQSHGVQVIDLTPAAIGPYVIPAINLEAEDATNMNMVTCGGQATIPIVAAVSRVAKVHYAEIVASISSKSAGPGTRANIDEFTETTRSAIEKLGGATRGKAIIVLNPAEPPLIMRDTVFVLSELVDEKKVADSIEAMVASVQSYVPGYRLKQKVQFEIIDKAVNVPGLGPQRGLKTSVFLEVEGSAHYLPSYAGNLDIMTSAALACGDMMARRRLASGVARGQAEAWQ